jgi:hypothetical protein
MTSVTGSERESHCICQELLDLANDDENFLKGIITSEETWVCGGRMWKSCWRFFLHQWCCASWLHTWGTNSNCWYYIKVLKRLRENVRRKSPQLRRNNFWFFHHDSAPAHASLLICDFLANTNTTVLPQSPSFPKLKSTLKGQRFQTIQEIMENSQTELHTILKKNIPGLFPEVALALGVVHQCRRGVLGGR